MKRYTINLCHLKSRVGKAQQESIFLKKKWTDDFNYESHHITFGRLTGRTF